MAPRKKKAMEKAMEMAKVEVEAEVGKEGKGMTKERCLGNSTGCSNRKMGNAAE